MTTTSANREIRELKNELQQLASIVEKSVKKNANMNGNHTVLHAVEDYLGFDTADLKKTAKKAGRDMRTFFDKKTDQATGLYQTAEKAVVNNPARAVAIAAAAGLVLSMLFRSGKSEE